MKKLISKYFVIIILLIFFIQGLWFIIDKSATCDEPAHIPAGWTYWKLFDFRMNPEHPPLIKYWAAIPLLFLDINVKYENSWNKSDEWTFGHDFIFKWNNDKPILFLSRLMVLILGAICGIVLWLFVKEVLNETAANISLLFFAFNPEIIAHSSLVTTDLGNMLFYLMSFYGLALIIKNKFKKGCIILFLGIALGHITKHSFVIILPFIALWLIFDAINKGKLKEAEDKFNNSEVYKFLKRNIFIFVLSCFIMYFTIWAVYGFKYKSIPDDVEYLVRWEKFVIKGIKGKTINFLRDSQIFPEAYTYGWNDVLKKGDRPTFIWGKNFEKGVWFYFPSTFILKTPLPLLILMIFSILYSMIYSLIYKINQRRKSESEINFRNDEKSFFIPAIILFPLIYYILIFVFFVRLNLGNRHILPIYPFVFAIASIGYLNLCKFKFGKITAYLLILFYILSVLYNAPNYISYMNFIGGGTKNGWKYISDSNYDWGQDLKDLKKWAVKHGNPHIYLSYFGNDDPTQIGLNYTLIPSFKPYYYTPKEIEEIIYKIPMDGYFAISTNHLNGLYLDEYHYGFNPYEYFLNKKPIYTAGSSIKIFYEDRTESTTLLHANLDFYMSNIKNGINSSKYYPMIAGALIHGGGTKENILYFLNSAINANPNDMNNYFILGNFYKLNKEYEIAKNIFEKLVEIDNDNIFAYNLLGDIYLKEQNYEKAEIYFLKAINVVPEYLPAWLNLAITYLNQKKWDKFLDAIHTAKKIEPESYNIDYILGQYYKEMKNYEKSLNYFNNVIEKFPGYVLAYNCIGCIQTEIQEYEKAVESFKKALSLEPNNPIIKENLEEALKFLSYQNKKN